MSRLNTFNDNTNAFLSIDRTFAADSAMDIVESQDKELVRQHIQLASFALDCPDRSVSYLPSEGLLPGNPMVVTVWVQSFVPIVDQLVSEFRRDDQYAHCTDIVFPSDKTIDEVFFGVRRLYTEVDCSLQACGGHS